MGKPTGNDLREGKVTLPLLYALANGDPATAQAYKEMLRRGNLSNDEIAELIRFARESGGIEYAVARMRGIEADADHLLDAYPDSEWKQTFRDLFDYIISRDH